MGVPCRLGCSTGTMAWEEASQEASRHSGCPSTTGPSCSMDHITLSRLSWAVSLTGWVMVRTKSDPERVCLPTLAQDYIITLEGPAFSTLASPPTLSIFHRVNFHHHYHYRHLRTLVTAPCCLSIIISCLCIRFRFLVSSPSANHPHTSASAPTNIIDTCQCSSSQYTPLNMNHTISIFVITPTCIGQTLQSLIYLGAHMHRHDSGITSSSFHPLSATTH